MRQRLKKMDLERWKERQTKGIMRMTHYQTDRQTDRQTDAHDSVYYLIIVNGIDKYKQKKRNLVD